MPYKNSIKKFADNTYYHAYTRGINKEEIFSQEDYPFFLYLLKKYLTPGFKESKVINGKNAEIYSDEVSSEVSLVCYTLMSNHFHLLLKNKSGMGISNLMRRVLSSYSRYFNEKNGRQGPLFQGVYRAVRVGNGEQLIHTARYIHLNPVLASVVKHLKEYPYTSYHMYLNRTGTPWFDMDDILASTTDYKSIESYAKDIGDVEDF